MKGLQSKRDVNKRVKNQSLIKSSVDHIANKGNPFHYFYQQTHWSIITTTVPYHIWTQMRLLVQ